MKNLFFIILCITCCFTQSAKAQNVAINQDASQPDTSAMLDVSSTTKGFLMPRMTSAQQAAIPSPATGLMLFNTTLNAFQANIGTSTTPSWGTVSTNGRSNYVLVKSASDLPAPVGGIITLLPTTTYAINGTITLTNKIELNGAWLTGTDAVNDKLIYTPASGELFTGGTSGGNIRNLTLSAPTSGSKLFNLDAGGANKNFIIENCYILGCNNIGKIKGYGGTVYFQTIAYFYNTNGITYENDNNLVITNTLWDLSNSNTFETLVGTFAVVQKVAGAMQPQLANTATAMNISGITSIGAGQLKITLFTGTGTYVNGTFAKQWEVDATGITTEKDEVATGNLYISTASSTTFAAANTAVKVAGTTTATGLFRVTSPSNNRLTYTGTKTRRFQVLASLSVSASTVNKEFAFYIYKNGVKLPESEQEMRMGLAVDKGSLTLSCTVQLAPNDYIEVWAANSIDATSMLVETLNLSIK